MPPPEANRPQLVVLLRGSGILLTNKNRSIRHGEFIFTSPGVIRAGQILRGNPEDMKMVALIIDFNYNDFQLEPSLSSAGDDAAAVIVDLAPPLLLEALRQLVDWSALAPLTMVEFRRREIAQLLVRGEHGEEIAALVAPSTLTRKVEAMIRKNLSSDLSMTHLGELLGMSESTLRRKLRAEGVNYSSLKESVKLAHGLRLLRTTDFAVGRIANDCGYSSHSHFSESFKRFYGISPPIICPSSTATMPF